MSMDCLEFRQIVGADPARREAALAEHRLACPACREFAASQERLSLRIGSALRMPVPGELEARILWRQANARPRRIRNFSIAATLLLSLGIGFFTYMTLGPAALGKDVIAHIHHEPELLLPTSALAEPQRVNAVLNRGGYRVSGELGHVSHAGLCPFRGRLVPHLVMNVDGEPVSVLLLPHETVSRAQGIHEDGFDGIILPSGDGSIAIVAPREDLILPVRHELEKNLYQGI